MMMKSLDVEIHMSDKPILSAKLGQFSTFASSSAYPSVLADAVIGDQFVVQGLRDAVGAPEWQQQLADLGFIAGEHVMLMARGAFGGDPLVVRIGLSTFALRKAEAACVLVVPALSIPSISSTPSTLIKEGSE